MMKLNHVSFHADSEAGKFPLRVNPLVAHCIGNPPYLCLISLNFRYKALRTRELEDGEFDQNNNDETTESPSRPDGGRPGWIAVLALWTRGVIWTGIIKGLGVMLPALQEQFGTNASMIGWITSLIDTVGGVAGLFAGLVSKQFRPGVIIMVCGSMIGGATIVGSFVSSPLQLALIMMLAGVGSRMSGILVKETTARYFCKTYATALGVGRTGVSVGFFLFPPLTQLFLNTYGWRGAVLLLGAISLHLTVCGALMTAVGIHHDTNTDQESPENESSVDLATADNLSSSCIKFLKNAFNNLDLKLLLSCRYWAVAYIDCCTAYACDMWVIYFVSQAESKGFSPEDATFFVTVAGVGGLISVVVQGFIIDRGILPYWVLMEISITIISASLCATPWLAHHFTMMTSSFLTLFFSNILICLNDINIKEEMGVDLMAAAFGFIGLKTAAVVLSLGFLPGWIYDHTGSYNTAFFMIGCVQASALIPLLALRYFRST